MYKRIATKCLLLVLVFLFATFVVRMYLADVYLVKARSFFEMSDYKQVIKYADKAIAQNNLEPSYHVYRANAVVLQTLALKPEVAAYLKLQALADIEYAISLNKINLVTLRNALPVYFYMAYNAADDYSYSEEYFLQQTKLYITMLKTFYPNDAGVLVEIAEIENALQMESEYNGTVEMIKALRPDLLEWKL